MNFQWFNKIYDKPLVLFTALLMIAIFVDIFNDVRYSGTIVMLIFILYVSYILFKIFFDEFNFSK